MSGDLSYTCYGDTEVFRGIDKASLSDGEVPDGAVYLVNGTLTDRVTLTWWWAQEPLPSSLLELERLFRTKYAALSFHCHVFLAVPSSFLSSSPNLLSFLASIVEGDPPALDILADVMTRGS